LRRPLLENLLLVRADLLDSFEEAVPILFQQNFLAAKLLAI
jgi:hypothetical protein